MHWILLFIRQNNSAFYVELADKMLYHDVGYASHCSFSTLDLDLMTYSQKEAISSRSRLGVAFFIFYK